jgi:hypothetical protein
MGKLTEQEYEELIKLRAEIENLRALGDTRVDLWEGVTKKGKLSRKIKLHGGAFGGWGLSFTPAQWDELMRIRDTVSVKVDEYRHRFIPDGTDGL